MKGWREGETGHAPKHQNLHKHNDREFIERIILSRKADLILEQTILEEGKVQKTLSSCKDWFLQRYFIF